jgi:insertion element IS1 protein InsB
LPSVNSDIVAHLKEGCGMRSIARLLNVSATTVIGRIQQIASSIKKPAITMDRVYEADELKTYRKNKANECRVIYAIDNDSRTVADLKVGKRNKKNIKGLSIPYCWQNVSIFIPTGLIFIGLLSQIQYTA